MRGCEKVDRKRRTKILINGDRALSKNFAEKIKKLADIEVLSEPESCLIMIKNRETAKNSLFYIGEVVAIECRVSVNGYLGIGITLLDDYDLAYDLAVIDGAYKGNLAITVELEKLLLKEERILREKEIKEEEKILKTKVDFSTMDVEY